MRNFNPNLRAIPRTPQPDMDWANPLARNPFGTEQERIAGRMAPQTNVPGMATNWAPMPKRPRMTYGMGHAPGRMRYGF